MNNDEWFAAHTEYLKSPEWAFKRGQVLTRDDYRCQAKLKGCERNAVQVHHLTYAHWRNEPLFDLASICVKCHDQITTMDRSGRATARSRAVDLLEQEPSQEPSSDVLGRIYEALLDVPLSPPYASFEEADVAAIAGCSVMSVRKYLHRRAETFSSLGKGRWVNRNCPGVQLSAAGIRL